jgi:hypothetical protein
MRFWRVLLIIGFSVFFSSISFSQNSKTSSLLTLLQDIQINVDTLSFSYKKDVINFRNTPHLAFQYFEEEQTIEVVLKPNNKYFFEGKKINIIKSADFDVLDSISWIEEDFYKARIRFKSISKSDFLNIIFTVSDLEKSNNYEVKLFPFTETKATFYTGNDDLYIGEEKRFEVITNNNNNLVLDGIWYKVDNFEYRLFENEGRAFISIIPNKLGENQFKINFQTKKPFLNSQKKVSYQLENQVFNFNVKSSRLSFIKIDNKEVIVSSDNREGFEIQLDNHRYLQINKTYRIEDREEKGGPLIAELYTLRRLSNDKILCVFRPYLLHQSTDGYLFIKDCDIPMFVTNINILPEAKIDKISILRSGSNWSNDRILYPGETVEIKINGEGLNQAKFVFEDLQDLTSDTIIRNDKSVTYKLRVPININKTKVEVYNNNKQMGVSFQIKEFQKAKPLDFVKINYGEGTTTVTQINQTILYSHVVKDVVLSFDYNKIDTYTDLFGKQFLEVDIRITGNRDELVEMQKIDLVEVCPGDNSPRSAFYQNGNCNRQEISLNALLSRKTHSLDEWSKIEITVRHKRDKYDKEGYSQRIVLVLQKLVTFDIDVSFPAGLIIKKVGVDGFPGLGGISLAMLAQFSFYDNEKIRVLKPYKIGAGFLAQNALNFNPDVQDRDLAFVVIGSLYPIRKERKLSFPLFGGFGYFINQSKLFYLIGPGIRISL